MSGGKSFTIIAWANFQNYGAPHQAIVTRSSNYNQYGYTLGLSPTGNLQWLASANGINYAEVIGEKVEKNNWYYYAVGFDYSAQQIFGYTNGSKRFSSSQTGVINQTLPLEIARHLDPPTYSNVRIGDIQIYNRALLPQEIVQNFESVRNFYGTSGYTTSGLTLNLDAGNYASYPTTGTKWVDISGNYNNGTLTNGPVWSNTSGGTITFDGVDDYINIPNGFTNTLKGKQYWTASIWVKVSSWGSNNDAYPVLVSIGANQGQYSELYLEIGSANQYYMAYAGDFASGSFTTNLNQIYNLVYMKDGSSFKLYSNGVLIDTQTGKNSVSSVDGDLWIGRFKTGDYELNGNIYNFTMYDRALSASEILQNYNALKGRFGL
jgi:hypothetical protein